jgi:hypothetical protein
MQLETFPLELHSHCHAMASTHAVKAEQLLLCFESIPGLLLCTGKGWTAAVADPSHCTRFQAVANFDRVALAEPTLAHLSLACRRMPMLLS